MVKKIEDILDTLLTGDRPDNNQAAVLNGEEVDIKKVAAVHNVHAGPEGPKPQPKPAPKLSQEGPHR